MNGTNIFFMDGPNYGMGGPNHNVQNPAKKNPAQKKTGQKNSTKKKHILNLPPGR